MDNETQMKYTKLVFFMGSLFPDESHNHVHGLLLPGKLFILKIMFLTSCDCNETLPKLILVFLCENFQ